MMLRMRTHRARRGGELAAQKGVDNVREMTLKMTLMMQSIQVHAPCALSAGLGPSPTRPSTL
jgi:hypothetical protein